MHYHEPIPYIRKICKDLSEPEIHEAEQNFREYVALTGEIILDLMNQEDQERDGEKSNKLHN